MNLTMSQDDQLRADIRIEYRIGRDELIAACILDLRPAGPLGPDVPPLRKLDIERAVRDCLHRGGSEIFVGWSDGLDDTTRHQLQEWATGQVRRHWPALFTTPTRTQRPATCWDLPRYGG
jgi:hypothetical protein